MAFHVLEHIPKVGHAVSAIHKLLADDGTVVVEVPNRFGNKRLTWDFNREHIHIFSLTSMSSLFEKKGFNIKEAGTDYSDSPIYSDSLRIVACKKKSLTELRRDTVDRFHQFLGKQYIVYGAGGDFESLVLPYIKASDVLGIIDRSRNKIGRPILGKSVQGLEAIAKYPDRRFLIATYRHQEEILKTLRKKGLDRSQIVTLEDVFGT